ncbi:MAG: ribokinase [Deltaproteobacteria bacterium]|nr:MAG: ribokinase [Deltaproteobacteria bacterium]
MLDVCVIGHVTKDITRINNRGKELPGGTAYYFSMALKNLGLNVAVVTKIGYNDSYLLDDLNKNNIPVFLKMNPRTTMFENSYTENSNHRVQKLKSIASPFAIEDVPDVSPSIFHIGPLTKGDIPLDLLISLSTRFRTSLDVQGFLRTEVGGCVKLTDWREKGRALSNIEIIKADETEAKILSGQENIEKAAKTLSEFGPKEVIITLGSKGSVIYAGKSFYRIPSYPQERIIDPTGCGDTYMAGYIYRRLKTIGPFLDFHEIGKFSAAVASLKLKRHGPFQGSRDDVESLLVKGEKKEFLFGQRPVKIRP